MKKTNVIILGSAPMAKEAAHWSKPKTASIVAINNAWQVRPDWDYLIHSGDFAPERLPENISPHQQMHSYQDYVSRQNRFGGFVYAGGTMAFTAGYWALDALKPQVLAYFGCDMIYDGPHTHFYGAGTADPLRDDVTLRSLEAKSARFLIMAAQNSCACVNLSRNPRSRLVFPRAQLADLASTIPAKNFDMELAHEALDAEKALGYFIEDGEYWHYLESFDGDALARIDALWLKAAGSGAPEFTTSRNSTMGDISQ